MAAGAVLRWGKGGAIAPPKAPNLSLAASNYWLQQQYAVVKLANSFTGSVFGGLEWLIW